MYTVREGLTAVGVGALRYVQVVPRRSALLLLLLKKALKISIWTLIY